MASFLLPSPPKEQKHSIFFCPKLCNASHTHFQKKGKKGKSGKGRRGWGVGGRKKHAKRSFCLIFFILERETIYRNRDTPWYPSLHLPPVVHGFPRIGAPDSHHLYPLPPSLFPPPFTTTYIEKGGIFIDFSQQRLSYLKTREID